MKSALLESVRLPLKLRRLNPGGPSTLEGQAKAAKSLKTQFRQDEQLTSRPLSHLLSAHLNTILRKPEKSLLDETTFEGSSPLQVAQRYWLRGKLDKDVLKQCLMRVTHREELAKIKEYAVKAHIEIKEDPILASNLVSKMLTLPRPASSARLAGGELMPGNNRGGSLEASEQECKEINALVTAHAKDWLYHKHLVQCIPTLLTFSSRMLSFSRAIDMYYELLSDRDTQYRMTCVVRAMLREAVYWKDVGVAVNCLEHDMNASQGQENGIARWLIQEGEYDMAFALLLRAKVALSREARTGLDLATILFEKGQFAKSRRVCSWVESKFLLSVQNELKELSEKLDIVLGPERKNGSVHCPSGLMPAVTPLT